MPSRCLAERTTACHYFGHRFCDDAVVNRIERLHALTESLRRAGARGRTAEQLADEFEVTSRTIKRDLAALEASGLPVWGRTGPGGGYGLAQGSSLPPVNFTAAQALALSAAVAVSTQAPFSDAARTATRKVLDPLTRRQATDLGHRVWVDVGPSAPRRVMSMLEQALVEQVTVNLAYTDAQGRSTLREVEPIIFALTGGRWLLVGWCRLRDDVRWFDLSRIQAATATPPPLHRPSRHRNRHPAGASTAGRRLTRPETDR